MITKTGPNAAAQGQKLGFLVSLVQKECCDDEDHEHPESDCTKKAPLLLNPEKLDRSINEGKNWWNCHKECKHHHHKESDAEDKRYTRGQ